MAIQLGVSGYAPIQEIDLTDEELLLADVEDESPDETEDMADEVFAPTGKHRDDAVLDVTQLYLNEIGASPLLTAEEEVYYARLAQQGDEAARTRMIESNLRLVVKIARR